MKHELKIIVDEEGNTKIFINNKIISMIQEINISSSTKITPNIKITFPNFHQIDAMYNLVNSKFVDVINDNIKMLNNFNNIEVEFKNINFEGNK